MTSMGLRRLLVVLLVVVAAGWPAFGVPIDFSQVPGGIDTPISDACTGCEGMGDITCPVSVCPVQPAIASSPALPSRQRQKSAIAWVPEQSAREHVPGVPYPPPRLSLT
ncbi:exported hypothetical protein [uncultured Defluviicoccus sp.]|uniref:Uncharacterized protein n=1 Tax=metagenome TaxID=256318 RepID=A0A380TH77_9ZZZZ|nr:exported hypothetical protein [uncultured Defluviicoccus sp.]